MSGLATHLLEVSQLEFSTRMNMLDLMREFYLNVDENVFFDDLDDKQWVILITDKGNVKGFSSQKLIEFKYEERVLNIVFSGDTIVSPDCRNYITLPLTWGRMMLSLQNNQPKCPLYWLLTSKGYKTYRFLPSFFLHYVPRLDAPQDIALLNLRNHVAKKLFPESFIPEHGILKAPLQAQKLRPGVAEIDDREDLAKLTLSFQRMNPGHADGDELVCLAPFSNDNLLPGILRKLQGD